MIFLWWDKSHGDGVVLQAQSSADQVTSPPHLSLFLSPPVVLLGYCFRSKTAQLRMLSARIIAAVVIPPPAT